MNRSTGKTAIVTGTGTGIGAATAQRLAEDRFGSLGSVAANACGKGFGTIVDVSTLAFG